MYLWVSLEPVEDSKVHIGEIDINDASRQIKDKEKAKCAENGIDYIEIAVAFDGLSVVTHPDNDFVDAITVEELNKIWHPESAVSNWSQVRADGPTVTLSCLDQVLTVEL